MNMPNKNLGFVKQEKTIDHPYITWEITSMEECYCGLAVGHTIIPYSEECTCSIEGSYYLVISKDLIFKLDTDITDDEAVTRANKILGKMVSL